MFLYIFFLGVRIDLYTFVAPLDRSSIVVLPYFYLSEPQKTRSSLVKKHSNTPYQIIAIFKAALRILDRKKVGWTVCQETVVFLFGVEYRIFPFQVTAPLSNTGLCQTFCLSVLCCCPWY